MRKIFTISLIIFGFFTITSNTIFAQLLTEPFNYVPDPVNGISAQSSGVWVRINSGDSILVTNGNLNYPGLTTSLGNMISYGGAGGDNYRVFTNQTTGTIYASYLLKVTNISAQTTTGGYTIGFMENGSTTVFGATLWIRNNAAAGTTQYNLGINPRTTAANTSWAPNVLDTGVTYLVVASYEIVAGATNDIVRLWINPVNFNGTQPTPDASATNTLADLTTGVQKIFCRQDAAGTTPTMNVDEMRVGTTWAEVTPSVITENTTIPALTFANLTVGSNATLTLSANTRVTDSLFLQSGNITTGANTLTLGTNILNIGTLVRTSGTIIGNFTRWFAPSTVSNVLFPVGTATNYRPATISFSVNPFSGGTITIGHTDGTDGSDLAVPFVDGAYLVERRSNMFWTYSSNIADGLFSLSLDGNGQTGITDLPNLRVIYSPDGTVFTAPGTHVDGSGSSVGNRSGLVGVLPGNFYLGGNNTNNPLPVELDNFVATTIKNEVILDWATGHELNNSGFEIERAVLSPNQNRTDADLNFQTVAFVPSKGNSNSVQGYKYIDGNLVVGRFAYRLKQMDFNGNHTYFLLNNEIVVTTPNKFTISQNYPNPFNPATTIAYDMPFNGTVKLVVFDNIGREVATLVNGNVNAGYYKVSFNASSLPSGVYFYKVNATSGSEKFEKVFKMMLVK